MKRKVDMYSQDAEVLGKEDFLEVNCSKNVPVLFSKWQHLAHLQNTIYR